MSFVKVVLAGLIGYVVTFFAGGFVLRYVPALNIPFLPIVIQGLVAGLVTAVILKFMRAV